MAEILAFVGCDICAAIVATLGLAIGFITVTIFSEEEENY